MSTTASHTTPANGRKTWAIKCATGLDVRACGLTDDEASAFLDTVDSDPETVIQALQDRGATGKPRLPKAARESDFQALYTQAHEAGAVAAEASRPTPMVVQQRANPLDDSSPVVHTYAPVEGGVCGFAWINVRPGNSSFAKWLVASGKARKDSYAGGVSIWVHGYGQSMERKSAYADAFAKVLRTNGFDKAYAGSRID